MFNKIERSEKKKNNFELQQQYKTNQKKNAEEKIVFSSCVFYTLYFHTYGQRKKHSPIPFFLRGCCFFFTYFIFTGCYIFFCGASSSSFECSVRFELRTRRNMLFVTISLKPLCIAATPATSVALLHISLLSEILLQFYFSHISYCICALFSLRFCFRFAVWLVFQTFVIFYYSLKHTIHTRVLHRKHIFFPVSMSFHLYVFGWRELCIFLCIFDFVCLYGKVSETI